MVNTKRDTDYLCVDRIKSLCPAHTNPKDRKETANMSNDKPQDNRESNIPGRTNPAKLTDSDAESKMVEVPLSTQTSAINVIPDEVPRHDGPGGE